MYTIQDLAKRYTVTTKCILDWRKSGHLPAPLIVGKRTIRWRPRDIELHDDYLVRQADYAARGLDIHLVEKPSYTMPEMRDPYQLAREADAAATDPPSDSTSLVEQLEQKLAKLTASAAVIASRSKPGQLSEKSLQKLRDTLPEDVRELLMRELPEENRQRLEEILK